MLFAMGDIQRWNQNADLIILQRQNNKMYLDFFGGNNQNLAQLTIDEI